MGQEISNSEFSEDDVKEFEHRLREETHLLRTWKADHRFSSTTGVAGFELEAWLVDRDYNPVPGVEALIEHMGSPLVVPELSKFNFELNCPPHPLEGASLKHLENVLQDTWTRTKAAAQALGMDTVMIGILPTALPHHMTLENMAPSNRFHALNAQILKARKGAPITLDIEGTEHLQSSHADVMTEAAATSFQVHLQVAEEESARFFNASKIIAAPVLAASANSPFLFGQDLWAETRIPLFEQSVSVAEWDYAERVTFGVSYSDETILESFSSNLTRYPVLLPRCFQHAPDLMNHVRLHNGTIWRWNRPLIGYDDQGVPHIRVEHRSLPAGPTVVDSIANAAFYYGLLFALARRPDPPEYELQFACSRDNFYAAARDGLDGLATWFDGEEIPFRTLILEACLPLAAEGLDILGINAGDRDYYLGIMRERVTSRQTGAAWQRAFAVQHGRDMNALCRTYSAHQEQGSPVHAWPV